MQWMQSLICFKALNNSCSQTGTKQACRMVSGVWRRWVLGCWGNVGMLAALGCSEEELRGKGLVQMLLRIPWSSVSELVLRGEMELWSDVGKPNLLPCRVMGKVDVLWVLGVSQTPKRSWLFFECSECRSGCNCWLFPADPNFPQLRALGRIYFTPACKDFTWAFPFHHFQLWFGGCYFFFFPSVLFCAGGNSQLDTEAVKL